MLPSQTIEAHNKCAKISVYETAMVLAIAGLYFFSFFQRVAIPGTIFNDLQHDFAISASEVTRLSAIYLFVYALMQPFAGFLADRFGGIKVVLVSGLLLCAGSLVFPLSNGQWLLYASRALVGLGASTMYLCMVKETDHYFGGKNFAPVFGFLCLLGYSGGLTGTRPFRMMVEYTGWRNSCVIVAAATFAVLIITFLIMLKVNRDTTVRTSHLFRSIGEVLKNKKNYAVLLTTPLCFSLYFSLQATIGAKFLEDFCGISSLTAANYTFTMMLAVMSAMMFSGIISRLLGNRRKCFLIFNGFSTMLAMALMLCGVYFKLPPVIFLLGLIMPALASGCTPVNVSLMKELNDAGKTAISVGVMNTTTYVMVAVMSQATGRILDLFSRQVITRNGATIYPDKAYLVLFSVFLAISIIPCAASFFCRETYGKNTFRNDHKLTN